MTAKPYDPTLKALVETEPESWPVFLGQPSGPTEVIDADIATVSGAADKVLRVAGASPYLLHLEFVTGHDVAVLPRKLLVRNVLLEDRHDLPVHSGIVLLRPESDSPQLTGTHQSLFPGRPAHVTFHYQVTRVWQLDPEAMLTGGLALLPLAPISNVTESDLPVIIKRMSRRLSGQRRRQTEVLWGAAFILLGLRFSPSLAAHLFRGVVSMKESSTYQAILEEGRTEGHIEEVKKLLRQWGDEAFGPPDARIASRIEQLDDLAQLEELLKRVRTAGSWQELFAGRGTGRRTGRRPSSSP